MDRKLLLEESGLSLDVILLIMAGLMMIITGFLLFPASWEVIPYYENGAYGLMLFLFALQIILLGKTPFGDVKRSKPLIYSGLALASTAIATCFIPGIFRNLPRILLFLCFTPGGVALLAHMALSRDKLPLWVRHGGVLHLLWITCGITYVLSAILGVLILKEGLLSGPAVPALVILYGGVILSLSRVLTLVYRKYPDSKGELPADGLLSPDHSVILITGVFMILLGLFLVPVGLGFLPFAASAQLGLLTIIMAFRMVSSGSTPLGTFRRTRAVIIIGLFFASLGVASAFVPGILDTFLVYFIAALNIIGGLMGLQGAIAGVFRRRTGPPHPILRRLTATQFVLNLLSLAFGASMVAPGVVPVPVTGVILAANGGVLLYLLKILGALQELTAKAQELPEAS